MSRLDNNCSSGPHSIRNCRSAAGLMNYLAHGRLYLDRPYFVAGTAIPDWLSVVDRRVRVRRRHAVSLRNSELLEHQELARGVIQHHDDDDQFHQNLAFVELSLQFAVILRDELPADDGLRPSFLGHILVEILLDDCLAAENPGVLNSYYEALADVDPRRVAEFVELATGKSVDKLNHFVGRFLDVRFLYDYADNAKLLFRLNQVMRRVGLAQIPNEAVHLFPRLRHAVKKRMHELLTKD